MSEVQDEQLKREIEDALAVDPSPQFLARVRRHIASETERRPVRWPWTALAAGLATAIVIGAVVIHRLDDAPLRVPTQNAAAATAPPESPVKPAAVLPKPPALHRPATVTAAEPEILIDPREAAALRRFFDDIDEQKIDPAKLAALFEAFESSHAIKKMEPMPIDGLEPLVVPPLTAPVPEREGGSL